METSKRRAKRKAYSLAELILGAAVMAAFTVRIYQSYAATHASDQFTKLVNELSVISGTSQALYMRSFTFQGFVAGNIAGTIPRSYVTGDGTDEAVINTPYHTPISFEGVVIGNGSYGGLALTFEMPHGDCPRLLIGSSPPFDYAGTSLGTALKAPLSTEDANKICASSVEYSTITIVQTNNQPLQAAN